MDLSLKDLVKNAYYYDKTGMLLQGDCIEWMKQIPDNTIDLILTDPPYGIEYQNNYTLKKHKKIKNDDRIDYLTFGKECFRVLKNNTHAYFFTRFDVYPYHFIQLQKVGFKVKNVLSIERGSIGGIGDLKGSFANNSEWVIFCHKGRREFNETKLLKNKKPVGKKTSRYNNPIKEWKTRFNTCWFGDDYPKASYNSSWQKKNNIYHPTIKTIECYEWLIQISSFEKDIILDPFAGAGTLALSAKNTNRKWICIEIDKKYCELSVNRIKSHKTKV